MSIRMSADGDAHAERVLLVTPTRRDGEVSCSLLHRAGVQAEVCANLQVLAEQIERGLGALMLTDVALADPAMSGVVAALQRQPPWSDVPVVLLTRDRDRSPRSEQVLGQLSNVTLLDRPTSVSSMVSTVLTAIRARRRQYEIRDHLQAQQAAEQALRDADQRKNEFLATLAHELRNPLAPIRTGLQLLSRQPVKPGSPQAVLPQMMERQIGLLVKLIDDLLDVSRISTGKLALQCETVDMRDVVQAAVEGSRHAIDAGDHAFHTELGSAPVWVHGDPQRLAQVISNLLNNAAKYTPPGGEIALCLANENDQAMVQVQDNGAGIPTDMLDGIFGMFTQVNRTLQQSQGGLGIGLSLVRRLADLHGGSVAAQSRGPGHGSTFTLRIPSTQGPAAAEVSAANAGSVSHPAIRVLVIDDNVDAADTLADWFRHAGCPTHATYSGESALAIVDEFAPELVLCDIGLPGIDGHEVAARLRGNARHADAMLIAVTGWGSKEDRRRSGVAGFDAHLVKPVPIEQLAHVLARASAAATCKTSVPGE
jgi:two-component system, sensor histidine kinase